MDYENIQPTFVTGQPHDVISVSVDPFKQFHYQWATGLFNCCDDVRQCTLAVFCWPCFLAFLTETIDESMVFCCCAPNVLAIYRVKIRTILKIHGSVCGDCCIASCCGCCAALQMYNELKSRGLA